MKLTKRQIEAFEAAVSENGLMPIPGATFSHLDGITTVRDAQNRPVMWMSTALALEILNATHAEDAR